MRTIILSLLALPFLFACNSAAEQAEETPSSDVISVDEITRHVQTLASDEFEGRMPFTNGEVKTINYIKTEMEKMGIKPGNGDSYFQEVPLVEITSTPSVDMVISGGDESMELEYKVDYVALTRRVVESVEVKDSELVFAGYGTVAPEYDWNDYEGLDVKGKTVVVLVNDPGFGTGDDSFFKGETMTYYGRWTYKYEEAARQGAEGLIIVHDTKPASYPWTVVKNGWSGPSMYLKSEDNNMGRCAFEGWISYETAQELFTMAGKEGYDFTAESKKRDFKAFSLNQTVSVSIENALEESLSNNVIGLYEGSERADEYIIYSGHWDHFGIGDPDPVTGDSIYNGAVDNATGIAAILEMARAFTQLETKPKRSILFLAVTAEEQGLLGSAHYASNPIYPVEKTVANINIDAIIPMGEVENVKVIGYGQSELEDYASEIAENQGRYTVPNPTPGEGSFFRSDHFNFAKVGIPALYAKSGYISKEKGEEWGEKAYKEYYSVRYHQPSDEYDPNWDLTGLLMDTQLLYEVGLKVASEDRFPEWKEGSEFKAIREASLAD